MVTRLAEDCSAWLVSKGRINTLGDELRSGKLAPDAERWEQCYRLFRVGSLPETFARLCEALGGQRVLLSARLKRRRSLRAKLQRMTSIKLSQVVDVVGYRVICENVVSVEPVVGSIRNLGWRTKIRTHDPAPSGYRATHLELQVEERFPSGKPALFAVEIQVRTYYQHLWALRSEAFGERVKKGGGRRDKRKYLVRLSDVVSDWERSNPETVQRPLPPLARSGGVAIVRQIPIGGAPLVEKFDLGAWGATEQLTEWERLTKGDTLFLAFSGSIRTISTTHSVYMLGTRLGVPLEPWMPKWEEALCNASR